MIKKIFKKPEKRTILYRYTKIKIITDFSAKAVQFRMWLNNFETLKDGGVAVGGHPCYPRILHAQKTLFKNIGEVNIVLTNRNWNNLLLAYLFYKKCQRKLFRWRKMTLDGNLNLYKGMDIQVVNVWVIFFLFLKFLQKMVDYLKSNNNIF